MCVYVYYPNHVPTQKAIALRGKIAITKCLALRDRLCQNLIQVKIIMTQQTLEAQIASSQLKRLTILKVRILQSLKPIVDSK